MQFLHPGSFIFVEIETEHISFFQPIVLQISNQLILPTCIVFLTVP